MPQMDIGEGMSLDPKQLAVLTGQRVEGLQPGHVFSWGPGRFRIAAINPDSCQIIRLARRVAMDTLSDIAGPSTDWGDTYTDPANLPGSSVGDIRTKPKTGPLETKVSQPGTLDGGGIVEKLDALGPELKQPHPPILRSPQVNEPEDNGRRISSEPRFVLMRMLGFGRKP